MENSLKRLITEEGGTLQRYLEGIRNGDKALSNIKQIIEHFLTFVCWANNKKDNNDINAKKLIDNIIKIKFTVIRDYSDFLIERGEDKPSSIRNFMIDVGHCLHWFSVYVLRDVNAMLSGNIFFNFNSK
jgi:hypothetical protein